MSVSEMIFTARQLQDLHRNNGHVTLPVGARLTPLASDWVRHKRIRVQYGADAAVSSAGKLQPPAVSPASPAIPSPPAGAGEVLWWCDGPCGQAKAALAQQARESSLAPMQVTAEPKYIVQAVKSLAREIREGRAAAGVLLVQSGAGAVVYANRCPSLRAILGTCRQSVEQGVQQVSANVLIIEHPYQTLLQVRNMLAVFARGVVSRTAGDEVARQLKELTSCG